MRLTQLLCSSVGKWSKQFSNLPDRYIERTMNQVYWKNPKGSQYKPNTEVKRKKFRFSVHRPWTAQFRQQNSPGKLYKKVFVEPIKDWSFFRGDRVEVLVGPDKGKQGYVKQIIEERNWVFVEGLNCTLKDMGGDKKYPGIYVKMEQPLLVTTQVSLVDPSDLQATAFEWRFTEEGDKVRVSTRTGRIIPLPASIEETIDYKSKATYKEQPKDTLADDVSEVTFQPALKTFQMDIMESMDIKDERVPLKTYWY
ncbi:PREDICTED: probable 39S ribosomal protein L24, mitochondrial [Nicrophorus vespilloides]|uniref:Large ribosomal subunit protein uL24m n=1 Tax=Nicrophorus vespilloides TaxID=110193 RepID=A0ABM1M4V4_NICVS|nr:PREDICTED: probable 39S ribosomal protein L24, mitochondrial [Nicrophorus vespilloides]